MTCSLHLAELTSELKWRNGTHKISQHNQNEKCKKVQGNNEMEFKFKHAILCFSRQKYDYFSSWKKMLNQ